MLHSEGVVLTELREADRQTLFEWVNEAASVRFNAAFTPVSWAAHCRWFDAVGTDPARFIFAIRRVPPGPIAGTVQLQDIHRVHRSAELTIRIGAEADRGEGLGTAALRLALRFAFDDLNLQRVWLRVFASNQRAISVYSRVGFAQEGTMRRAAFIAGRWEDIVVMAALRSEPA
jgi:RimJ/RimL family protein N-acetyltransferase